MSTISRLLSNGRRHNLMFNTILAGKQLICASANQHTSSLTRSLACFFVSRSAAGGKHAANATSQSANTQLAGLNSSGIPTLYTSINQHQRRAKGTLIGSKEDPRSAKDEEDGGQHVDGEGKKKQEKETDPNKKDLTTERRVINAYEHNPPYLMEFFDHPKNWGEDDVKSGRPWKLDELRIKSNSDLHKLWFVLLKELNMLLTMEEACKRESRVFPSEERIYKVRESMSNVESVVRERNRAYWQLEVDKHQTGTRPWAFRKDTYGRYYWIPCNEHLIPYEMNRKFKVIEGPGTGRNVREFVRRWREKRMLQRRFKLMKQAREVRQLLRRFPDLDMEYLQEKYPRVPVQKMKEDLSLYQKERDYIDEYFFTHDKNKLEGKDRRDGNKH